MEGIYSHQATPQLRLVSNQNALMPAVAVTTLPNTRSAVENIVIPVERIKPRRLPFIEANTKEVSYEELESKSVVPTFAKDNELTVSHTKMINAVSRAVKDAFPDETISEPSIRVSHPIKGRIPEAIHKPVNMLLESDKTLFYERAMFCIEVPSISRMVGNQSLTLMVGAVRAYNEQNLNTRKTAEKFKLFIGFKVMCCCNLCVSSDGYVSCVKAMDEGSLYQSALELFKGYDMESHIRRMQIYQNFSMSESQFAQFLGKCRLYQYLPSEERKTLPSLLMTDTQIGIVARSYYDDKDFGRHNEQRVSMWDVFNYLTEANKSSYIDNFLDRSTNATEIADGLCKALQGDSSYSWFIE